MFKSYKPQAAMGLAEKAVLLKDLGVLSGSGLKGFYVYAGPETAPIVAISAVMDVIEMIATEFKMDLVVEMDQKKLERACYHSMDDVVDRKGNRIIALVKDCKLRK